MSKSAAVVALACQIVKLRDAARMWKQTAMAHREDTERLQRERFMSAGLIDKLIEAKMVEHRAAFGARTEADAKIIDGLRQQIATLSREEKATRDVLRAEVAQHRKEHAGDQQAIVGLLSERDKLRAEVTALKHEVDTLSCPYVSGQRVRVKSEGGLITQQSEYGIGKIGIINAFAFVARIGSRGWVDLQDIEPCDPPADHDTPAGKEAAEAAIQDEIKVGDVVEVVSASGGQTWMADVGSTGKVRRFEVIDSIECVRLQNLPGKRNALGGYVSLCDVRKVPQ